MTKKMWILLVGLITLGIACGNGTPPRPTSTEYNPPEGSTEVGVYFNGQKLNAEELLKAEQIFGPISPGRYWLDRQGNYGIEGGVALGNIYDGSTNGGYYHAGPGGVIGSDGTDSYYYDPGTGCSVMDGEVIC